VVRPPPPAELVAASATSQAGREGAAVEQVPAVLVRDADGNPVRDATVRFEVVAGRGTVSGAVATSDASGRAAVGAWTLGVGAQQVLRATLPDAPRAVVSFFATASSAASRYDVTLRYLSPVSDRQRAAFEAARRRIEGLIVGDLADVDLRGVATESCAGVRFEERVDDLLVAVRVIHIDGAEGTLGRAGPCFVRSAGLPVLALMEFDSDDLDALAARGQLESVILHEMLHTVGFGTVWGERLVNGGAADPFFDGGAAREAFTHHDGGSSYRGVPVPVEDSGNPGTRDAHWREAVLGDELMTGWLTGHAQPLSRTTAASLQDLGYVVDLAAADSLTAARGLRTFGAAPAPVHVGDDVLRVPVYTVD
jgi:hypothetical protein